MADGERTGAPGGRSEASRARLADAALHAFATKGFHGTTTRDLATAAGMSPAALYVHHRSKEDLLFELCVAAHRRTLEIVELARDAERDPVAQLGRLVEDFVRHHALEHTSARVVNYELAALAPDHLAAVVEQRRAIQAVVEEVVAAVMDAGAGRPLLTADRRMTVALVLSLGVDVARWFQEGGWSADALALHHRDAVLRMVGVES